MPVYTIFKAKHTAKIVDVEHTEHSHKFYDVITMLMFV